jgi:8-oxo-dGTP pyrophosphatase MutT (NUDIX family)
MLYYEKPEGFVADHEGVGCFVECKGEILNLLRADRSGKFESDKWGCPAGAMEKGESPVVAILRGLWEETGLRIHASRLWSVAKFYVDYSAMYKCKFVYHVFWTPFPFCPEIQLSCEHTAKVWIQPHLALNSLPLVQDQDACIKLVFGISGPA